MCIAGEITLTQEIGHVTEWNAAQPVWALTNLRWLKLGPNALTGTIPESIGQLTNLQWLTLSSNALTGKTSGHLLRPV